MASHAEHHYVPRFLLEQWHSGVDEKLTQFSWANGRLVNKRYKAKSVAKERHLYSMERSQSIPDVQVERDFWGPHIDDPASVVHAKMLRSGVASLGNDEKQAWSPFLVSQMLRVPNMIRHIRARGREILISGLVEEPEKHLSVAEEIPTGGLKEWVEESNEDVLDDLGVMALPELAFSEKLNLALLNVPWGIRSIKSSRYNFLISDNPLIVAGTLETSFLVALPISPTKVFFAFNQEQTFENLKRHSMDEFVRAMNVSSVVAAEIYVYGTDTMQEQFVRKFLGAPV